MFEIGELRGKSHRGHKILCKLTPSLGMNPEAVCVCVCSVTVLLHVSQLTTSLTASSNFTKHLDCSTLRFGIASAQLVTPRLCSMQIKPQRRPWLLYPSAIRQMEDYIYFKAQKKQESVVSKYLEVSYGNLNATDTHSERRHKGVAFGWSQLTESSIVDLYSSASAFSPPWHVTLHILFQQTATAFRASWCLEHIIGFPLEMVVNLCTVPCDFRRRDVINSISKSWIKTTVKVFFVFF